MTVLSYIQLSTEVVALITATVFFKALKKQGWLLWLPFLLSTCIVEFWAAYLAYYRNQATLWLYNPYIIASVTFYSWFLIRITTLDKKKKRNLFFAVGIYSLSCIVWYLLWGDPRVLISVILNIGSLFICALCLLFFYSQIRNPFLYDSLLKVPGFWIATGLLIFYAGIALYTAIYNFLAQVQLVILGATIQNFIPQVLSLILYSTITIAFVQCRYHQRK